MKTDLDRLMQENQIDVVFVVGAAQHNPAMVYFTGRVHVSQAELIKVVGKEPVLYFASPMEREEAARTGLVTQSIDVYQPRRLLEQAQGDAVLARAMRYQRMLEDAGVQKGRMAIYGQSEVGLAYSVFTKLCDLMPGIEIVSEFDHTLLGQARSTKDAQEIQQIRRMGEITIDVVGQTADFLTRQKVVNGVLMKSNGEPLRIGEVKRQINLWLAERGAENPHGTVFAIGRDAAIPHSAGDDQMPLEVGKTIVFDIFPCQEQGGYYYDFTRTWCLGYAPDDVQALYEDVRTVYQEAVRALRVKEQCSNFQKLVCDLFEERGHPTVKSNPLTEEGYVHSLGHGVGLQIHERPWFGTNATEKDILSAGSVFTIEPGLYYPSRGMGVRLEDTYVVKEDGSIEPLAYFPLDLVLPLKMN
ncbi:MAG: Xaa-Pro aminopeptidase [Anaerolineae bacterium]|jgi:Xaa-Pro aminopeptidase|nr:MAG: Xaa-Pro aminopeptidase [Anaerolineae bacterium]